MNKQISIAILILLISFAASCKKKEDTRVPIEQLKNDNTHDYRFIFRKDIADANVRDSRYKKNEFSD